jgi:hypothetical protein
MSEDAIPEARVSFGLSRTVNLQQFNSVRFEVGVDLPCGSAEEALKAGFVRAVAFVTPRMLEIFTSVANSQHALAQDPLFYRASLAAPPPPPPLPPATRSPAAYAPPPPPPRR